MKNKNRGYLNLDVWQKSMMLFKLVWETVYSEAHVDYKLRSQVADSSQAVSANIAEGYSRRSINEYIQFLYISLASLSETLTRITGLKETGQITDLRFQQIDKLLYEVENKLLSLVQSLERKRDAGGWIDHVSEENEEYYSNELIE